MSEHLEEVLEILDENMPEWRNLYSYQIEELIIEKYRQAEEHERKARELEDDARLLNIAMNHIREKEEG